MKRVLRMLAGLFNMFGGLIIFYAALALAGTYTAIAATLVYVIVDGGRRLLKRETLPPMYLPSALLGIGFGLIDLLAPSPFMLKWEPLIGNLLMAGFFAAGAHAEVPLPVQFAGPAAKNIPLHRPEVMRFLRFWTYVWAAYFVVRGAVIVWIMHEWPLAEALVIRSVFGWVTMGILMALSFAGRRVMQVFQWFGMFRPRRAVPAAVEQAA